MDAALRFTVIISTLDHQDTLRYSVASALAQTVEDIEVIVIGDGAPPATAAIMAEFASRDARVRYQAYPKGPGHGEVYRHEQIQASRGRCIAYLGDDDLWLPHHLATLECCLADADFAKTVHCEVLPDGDVRARPGDLNQGRIKAQLLTSRENCFGPTCAGHTRVAYDRLPHGWRTKPADCQSDLHMWRQWVAQPWCRFACHPLPTTLHFASPRRTDMSLDQRLAELATWHHRLTDPQLQAWCIKSIMTAWQQEAFHEHELRSLIQAEFTNSWLTDLVMDRGPERHDVINRFTKRLIESEHPDVASLILGSTVERFPRELSHRLRYAQALILCQRPDEALVQLAVACDLLADDDPGLIHLVRLLAAAGDRDRARAMAQRLIERDPDDPDARHVWMQLNAPVSQGGPPPTTQGLSA